MTAPAFCYYWRQEIVWNPRETLQQKKNKSSSGAGLADVEAAERDYKKMVPWHGLKNVSSHVKQKQISEILD